MHAPAVAYAPAHLASADRFQESRAGMDLLSPVAATFTLQYFLASAPVGISQHSQQQLE